MEHKSNAMNVGLALGIAGFLTALSAQAAQLGYAETPGNTIQFDGAGHFSFSTGDNLQITTSDGSFGDSVSDLGSLSGVFTIGPISTLGLTETASVTGSGLLTIHDANGYDLTASVTWDTIVQVGSSGGLNFLSDVNLSGVSYFDPYFLFASRDLESLAAEADPAIVLEFAALGEYPGTALLPDLKMLTGGGKTYTTTFSGEIITADPLTPPVPDGGMTITLLGFALAAVQGLRRKVRA